MKRRMFLILSAFALLLASCSNKDSIKSDLTIPKDAAMVIHINGSSLSSKISWDEIRQSNWFKEMPKDKHEEDSTAQRLLADPASSGINTKADIILYTKKEGSGSYMIVAGSLADAAAFEKLCKDIHKDEKTEVKKEDGFSYITSGHGAVVWNSSHFAFAGNSFLPGISSFMKRRGLSGERPELKSGFLPDSLKIFGMEALTPKSKNNLEADDRFSALIKDGRDVHFWINASSLYSGMSGMGAMMPMMDMNSMFEGNVSAISLNFDNGKISGKMKQYYGEKMSKLMSNYKAEPVSADVINRIPSSNVVGVIAFNYSPGSIKEFLKITGAGDMIDMALAKMDFGIDDFIKANKGQVLISFSDPNTENEKKPASNKAKGGDMHNVPSMKTGMKVLFATAVNDKVAFEKMVTMVWDMVKKLKGGDIGNKELPFSYKLENNWFAASNSQEFTDKFLAGGDNKLPFTDKITGHPIGMYIDLQKMMGSVHSKFSNADTANKKGLAEAMKMWQDIVATGGEYKDDATQFEVEVNLVDKNTNSLKQMNQYFDKMLSLKKERKKFEIKEVTLEDIKQIEKKPEPPPPPPPSKKKNK